MLKDDINQLLKELYTSKQITKQLYNNLSKVITYKNDSKEQIKILDDKIKTNIRQYQLILVVTCLNMNI